MNLSFVAVSSTDDRGDSLSIFASLGFVLPFLLLFPLSCRGVVHNSSDNTGELG